jgi:carbon starvation protein
MPALLLLASIVLFSLAYRVYGAWVSRQFGLDDSHRVPSSTQYDGTDFVPTASPVLFGHHFSSIAGAGPIVGPILAGLFFGWAPAVIWIILGSIFVGGIHDFGSLIASVRHKARSVAELARDYITPLSFKLFLAFILLALVYVIVVFMDLTAASFVDTFDQSGAESAQGTGVAVASGLFMLLALLFGVATHTFKMKLGVATAIFVPVLFAAIAWASGIHSDGSYIPALFANPKHFWIVILLGYCVLASVTPVWVLLHPRDYLSSYLLYAVMLGGGIGVLVGAATGGLETTWPAWVSPSHPIFEQVPHLGPLFPILFITIACGACSGFHSVVSSGTTAKQVACETDTRRIGYGGMLVEGVVAVLALGTIMGLSFGGDALRGNPVVLFSNGIGRFMSMLGLPFKFGSMLGLLALSTFLLTTLDTCTRLGRYVLQEFFGWDNAQARVRWMATLLVLVAPAILAFMSYTTPSGEVIPVWRAIWPVFGGTNQLLAGLALLALTMWLRRTGRRWLFAAVPMAFMIVMTVSALVLLITNPATVTPVRVIAAFLLALASVMIVEGVRAFKLPRVAPEPVVLANGDVRPATV